MKMTTMGVMALMGVCATAWGQNKGVPVTKVCRDALASHEVVSRCGVGVVNLTRYRGLVEQRKISRDVCGERVLQYLSQLPGKASVYIQKDGKTYNLISTDIDLGKKRVTKKRVNLRIDCRGA